MQSAILVFHGEGQRQFMGSHVEVDVKELHGGEVTFFHPEGEIESYASIMDYE